MGRTIPFLDVGATYRELQPEIDEAIRDVLRGGWYVLGREVAAFEAEYARFTESKACVGTANGLDALELALQALGIGPGDEVIVPANTYIATWLAVSRVGAVPVPVEPTPGTWTIDPARIPAALTGRTRAILPVHLYGMPADLEPILALARRHGLRVVEDAAQAHGARYGGRRIGAHGDLVCWSFYPGKNLGCFGDGGAITTDDPVVADRVRVLRNYGSRVKYLNEVKGRNSRLDELQAAVLRVKLARLDEWNARREALARRYVDALGAIPALGLPRLRAGSDGVWHLFVIDVEDRDRCQARLKALGVETMIHYPVPPHRSDAYAADRSWPALPITERASRTHLSLPMGPHLAEADQEIVVEALREWARAGTAAPHA